MKLTMLSTQNGKEFDRKVKEYVKGETYDIEDASLADVFLREKYAVAAEGIASAPSEAKTKIKGAEIEGDDEAATKLAQELMGETEQTETQETETPPQGKKKKHNR
jgi:hypothetical protein